MKLIPLIIALSCLCSNLTAQRIINGKITDADGGSPLIGATVQLQSNPDIGTATDFDGTFSLRIPKDAAALVFSYTGYTSQTVDIQTVSNVAVTLSVSATILDEIVVVGYGTQVRSKLTGNIASIKQEDIEGRPVTSLESTIQGQAAGVFVSKESGKLGQNIDIRIRGIASVNAGIEPLYVVDGVVISSQDQLSYKHPRLNPLADINFNDIASINILKDASAAAIYGSRASNGVVIITTKQGQANDTRFDLDMSMGWSEPTRKRKWLNATQYLELWDEAFANVADADGTLFGFSGEQWKNFQIPGWDGGHDTNWEEEIYNKDAGQRQVQLSVSGGNDKTKYYISGGLLDQTGILIINEFERISGRLNLTHQSSRNLDLGMNMSLSRSVNNEITHDADFANPVQLIAQPPVQPLYDPDNPNLLNPNTLYFHAKHYEDNTDWVTTNFRTLSNVFLNWKPVENLTLHTDFGLDLFTLDFNRFYGAAVSRNTGEPNGWRWNFNTTALNYSTNNYLTYTAQAGQHSFLATLGMNFQEMNEEFSAVQGRNFPNDDFHNLTSAGEIFSGDGEETAFSIVSYFGRLYYDFDGQYLLALSARTDGDSRFGKSNRYGFFPAVSAGWVLSKAPFLKEHPTISYLKLRASWGQTGNTPLDHFPSLGLFEGTKYAGASGITQTQVPNPDLKWEKTTQIDVGVDFGLWEDRISGQFDYYEKNTEDLLLQVNIPATSGFSTQLQNIGTLKNWGFEAMLTSYNFTGAFKWKTSLNFSKNNNEVTDILGQVIEAGIVSRAMEGQPVGVFFAPEFAGVDPDNGDALYYLNTDLENEQRDRNTTSNINEAERVVIGNPNPDFIYGINNTFSWKGLELQVLFQGVYGNEIYNSAAVFQRDGFGWFDNQDIRMLKRWQKPGDQTDIPQVRFLDSAFDSSRFIENGTYLRLKNVMLAYQLPKNWIQKIGLQHLKLYFSGQNLWTLTDYKGWDPEVNSDVTNFITNGNIVSGDAFYSPPQAKTVVVGIKARF